MELNAHNILSKRLSFLQKGSQFSEARQKYLPISYSWKA